MGTPTQVCVWSCPNFSAPAGRPFRSVSDIWLLISCDVEADRAQTSRVPVPLLEDPYEAIRQAYLDGTDTESEPFEDPIDTETPETIRMAVRIPPAMSSGLSASMAKVAAISESAFHKRFWSFCKSSPFVSPPDLPSRKRCRGTSELVEDKDEGLTAEDEDPAAGDEGLTAGVEGLDMDDESYDLDDESHGLDDEGHSVESDGLVLEEEEEVVPRGQQQAALVVGTACGGSEVTRLVISCDITSVWCEVTKVLKKSIEVVKMS
ncbi:hypothetical protein Tco_1090296 [Tanacetum coccineum]|uniref:Uncharacterized protein n=1 Tax=Tanacetum coccineum TaxID=301880 RepID=A0ABQ5I5V7_9ASTR